MGYGSQEYATGYGPAPTAAAAAPAAGAPPPGYGQPPPPSDPYGAPPPGYPPPPGDPYGGYGYPPPGYPPPGYPGFPGYGPEYFAAYGYPPPGYMPPEMVGFPPPPGACPPPPSGIGYGPTDSRGSRDGGRDRDRGRGGAGGDGKRNRRGGAGRDKDKGGYGKSDDHGKGNRRGPYDGDRGGRGQGDKGGAHEPVQANNLYVTGLPGEIDEEKLKEAFSIHGKVAQCKVLPPRPGETKTVALVRFESAEEAKKIKDTLNGGTLPGIDSPISVRFAENKTSKEQENAAASGVVRVSSPGIDGILSTFEAIGPLKATRGHEHHKGQLYVAGLPPDTGNVHLYRLFGPFGSIGPKGVHSMMTPDGKCKGIAFVNFLEEESAQLAIATYNGAVLPDGTSLKVSMKMPKGAA